MAAPADSADDPSHGDGLIPARMLVVACGALAREVLALKALNGLDHVDLACLPAQLHNSPQDIPAAVRATIRANRDKYRRIAVAYADCGTGGYLDRVLAEEGVSRIPGAHCYAFFAGPESFQALEEERLGSFYLTDFLARHFRTMVIEPLGLDRHPELREVYFAHYTRLVYLAQTDDPALDKAARAAAAELGLPFEKRSTGYGLLGDFLTAAA
ncbi:DUF1638 domain-containing protein [Polymorphum gilvum]|uniref:DUF1638 domain-containing protein n=1 Tax=Polymorphum gilvum (strain LMG 25793 / CGMCC 1.9160 / SL003B-26A1) TaxID=991905 RepID=F2J5U3_POLGS|nr:DUF1638 domain-containing protein [Polymorphum gilvum]ADZ71197.1 hypothetical protein SL003B_2774 [Polymorphum gilvum SL003B-26A1]